MLNFQGYRLKKHRLTQIQMVLLSPEQEPEDKLIIINMTTHILLLQCETNTSVLFAVSVRLDRWDCMKRDENKSLFSVPVRMEFQIFKKIFFVFLNRKNLVFRRNLLKINNFDRI
ncbi:hypothetical protein ACJX0J_039922 [Zea mays]